MQKTPDQLENKKRDLFVAAAIFLAALVLYLRTLAPSVAFIFDDTLEIQYVVPRLGILHPTGYPLYTLLGKLFASVVRFGDAAFRLNLFSAVTAACAVAMLYLVIRRLTDPLRYPIRYAQGLRASGTLRSYRFPALVGAMTFAFGPAFWDQANVAEVYALQMLLSAIILYAALSWGSEPNARKFYVLAFAMGLGLTHHRLTLLIYPAIAIYVLLFSLPRRVGGSRGVSPTSPTPNPLPPRSGEGGGKGKMGDTPIPPSGDLPPPRGRGVCDLNPKTMFRAVILFLAPLALYLYLPLRASVGSANGLYENTPQGFFDWVMGTQYTAFLTQNPLKVQHDFAYYAALFLQQFTIFGLILAGIGIVWLARNPREWILLVGALVAEAAFAFNYQTADVQVHFLTTFLLLAIFVGVGADGVWNAISNFKFQVSDFRISNWIPVFLLTCLLAIVPAQLLIINYPLNDLSTKWDVYDYGVDLLSQPLENNATIVGILGEMTLVRYFQANAGLRPDVQTVPADEEATRLAAIENALKENRVVYLTRPLKGAAERYSLSSLGPLIRVQPQPSTSAPSISNPLSDDFGAMRLIGYDVDASRLRAIPTRWHAENGRVVRVTVYWRADEAIATDAMVSLKILNQDRRVVGQVDRRPVLDAYPTTAWRAGQVIADTYDVPVFLGATPGEYTIHATLYDAGSGAVIGARDLKTIPLAPDFIAPRREVWNIAHTTSTDFGAFALIGYTLDSDAAVRPGDTLPFVLLWRASQTKIGDSLKVRVWLEDNEGKSVASRDAALGSSFPPVFWQAGQYVRDLPSIRVPANVADGKYAVKLAVVRGDQLINVTPFYPSIATLGETAIKNRARVMTAPAAISRPLEATFEKKIRLLGYDFMADASRNARLTLYWKSLALIDTPYTVFVHLLNADNNVIASADAAPGSGEFPTTSWIENEYVTDVHSFAIPSEAPSGVYRLEFGWYDPTTGTRLKTSDGQERVLIAPVNIP